MGTKYNCDLCNADIPLRESVKQLKIDEEVLAEVCITCSSKIKTGISQQKAEANIPKEPNAKPEAPEEAEAENTGEQEETSE